MSQVERRVRFYQTNRHTHGVAECACFDHEVMLEASRPPDPRAVVKDDEPQSATDVLGRRDRERVKHSSRIANWMTGGWYE